VVKIRTGPAPGIQFAKRDRSEIRENIVMKRRRVSKAK
jgi:hypothetical protein